MFSLFATPIGTDILSVSDFGKPFAGAWQIFWTEPSACFFRLHGSGRLSQGKSPVLRKISG